MTAPELPTIKRFPGAHAEPLAVVAVLGAGDVGSAVAHALFQSGNDVLLIEDEHPTAPRRGMCWVDAVFDGKATLLGLSAVRVFQPEDALQALGSRRWLPLVVAPDLPRWIEALGIAVVVDARLRKHAAEQPNLRLFAAHSVGIGPGYTAGYNASLVVESAWGDELGRVIRNGPTRALAGGPRPILGAGRERLLYAPAAGTFHSPLQIGAVVQAGEEVGLVRTAQGHSVSLHAPLSGVLRGLTRSGVPVQPKTKLIEVDPRGDPALCFGLGERPVRIAQGVLQAVVELQTAARLQCRQPHAA